MSETVALAQGLPSHIQPGLIIGGKYRLEEEIGRGSMGTVYRAVHVTLGQRVAIKLISGEHLQSTEARKRFGVEAKAAAKLRSRHVVQVYDDGETSEGNPYIVLEYLEGETLEQRLERDHDLPLVDAVRIVAHVGRALARAHAQGIVHRDLKPANIFLVQSDDDEIGWIGKVLDFGIAKLEQGESGTTQAGTVLGTPLFMSPEQVRGASSVDHRADLYSLGMCLFHMLTGEYAYYSPNYSDILVGICTQPLPLLREKSPWVPEAVEQWFQRACAKEAIERFQSADEMTEALQAASGGAALSKHKSFPEGRIAPETLVGYATPAMATLQLDAGPASLARTQVVAHQTRVVSASAPIAITIGPGAHHEQREQQVSGDWTPPPQRRVPPLALGVGLGLLVVTSMTVTLSLLTPANKTRDAAPSAPARLEASPPPREPVPPAPLPATTATPEIAQPSGVSSVAAETPPRTPKPRGKAASPNKLGANTHSGSAPAAAPRPLPAKTPGSDLGF